LLALLSNSRIWFLLFQSEIISKARSPAAHNAFVPIGHRPLEHIVGRFLKVVVAAGFPSRCLQGLSVVMEELKAELTAEVEGAEVMVKQGNDVLMQVWKNNVSAHRRVYRNIMVRVKCVNQRVCMGDVMMCNVQWHTECWYISLCLFVHLFVCLFVLCLHCRQE
jgi:hypothetical protein